MKQIATALLGIGSTLLAGMSAPTQSTDLVVNFNTLLSSTETETSPQPAEATPDQPASPPPKGEPAPCIACGMG